MSKKNCKKMNRREALSYGVRGFFGAQLGLGMMNVAGSMMPTQGPLDKLRRAFLTGEIDANAAVTNDNIVIQICLIDKTSLPLVFSKYGIERATDSTDFPGLPDDALQNVSWRGVNLTQTFASGFAANMDADYNLAFMPQWTSNSGGHSLQNSDIAPEMGGLNYVISNEGKDTGMLGAVGFAIRADANDSRASFVGPGRIPMQTYGGVSEIRNTLKNSVAAVAKPDTAAYAFRKKLDQMAASKDKTLDTLQSIRKSVDTVAQPLLDAVAAPNVVMQQLEAAIALGIAGLGTNFMIAIPWDDTNGGGNLQNAGGSARLSPTDGYRLLGAVYERLSQATKQSGKNFVSVTVSDGGRSRNNGDSAAGLCIISGHKSSVNNGVFGVLPQASSLGNSGRTQDDGGDLALTGGSSTKILEHKHALSLVAKITNDIDTGVPLPKGISPKVS